MQHAMHEHEAALILSRVAKFRGLACYHLGCQDDITELERLIAAARSEADALAAAGGWAAVRVGFGDAETIDCETGRTVYVAG